VTTDTTLRHYSPWGSYTTTMGYIERAFDNEMFIADQILDGAYCDLYHSAMVRDLARYGYLWGSH